MYVVDHFLLTELIVYQALLAVYLLWAFDFSPNSEVSPTDGLAMDLKHYMVGTVISLCPYNIMFSEHDAEKQC